MASGGSVLDHHENPRQPGWPAKNPTWIRASWGLTPPVVEAIKVEIDRPWASAPDREHSCSVLADDLTKAAVGDGRRNLMHGATARDKTRAAGKTLAE